MIKNLIIVVLIAVVGIVVWSNITTKKVFIEDDVAVEGMENTKPNLLPEFGAIQKARDVVARAVEKVDGTVLDMSNKGLTKVSQDIFMQTGVTALNLSGNKLTGSLPAEVRMLSNLTVLNLSNNTFTGVPAEIGQLSELRVLDLSNNPITGLPYELGNLQKLEKLDVSGTNYAKADLKIIRQKLPTTTVVVTD